MTDNEEWEVLEADNDYEINVNYPHIIRKISTGRILKEHFDKDGYQIVNLNQKPCKKHRLVALQWIPNPDKLPQINHKNHNKTDNRIENLEWVSNQQNANDRSHYRNREIQYVDELPDNAIVVDNYNNCVFNNYYFADDRFFKQIHNGKYRIIPWCLHQGYDRADLVDDNNVQRTISRNKFKNLYNLD